MKLDIEKILKESYCVQKTIYPTLAPILLVTIFLITEKNSNKIGMWITNI